MVRPRQIQRRLARMRTRGSRPEVSACGVPAREMAHKPARCQACHFLERARLLEQMRGTRDDRDAFLANQQIVRRLV